MSDQNSIEERDIEVSIPFKTQRFTNQNNQIDSTATNARPFYPKSDTNSNGSANDEHADSNPIYDQIGSVKDQL